MATCYRPPSFWNYGSRTRVNELAKDFGIGQGIGSLYTSRVITALVSLTPQWIRWPDEERKEELGYVMRKEVS
ncbi:hypothetical protein BC939DRAFT_447931 [Gamsiella multidivaricata]|uniref:uncharacterized protein n=1 Tax=Gamsiella multidivaricata TaxID=101098 RepID=UPI002220EDD9|nr:uncharacterized protein BC939DRAFT_447931 [Gamsiella multidivaricata]KAI7825651.1 hypothetical protein BC939DRAFT_447931 [Gamsiella multidivaricata]